MSELVRNSNRLIPIFTPKEIERFWSKVSKGSQDSCWEWEASRNCDGRGRFWLQGSTFYAPRISYFLENNQDPGDFLICHSCNNPQCCNPSHLYAGEVLDNSKDSIKAGSQVRGESQGLSKLTEVDVLKIRELYQTGQWSQRALGKHFGVSQHPIKEAIHRRTWKHV